MKYFREVPLGITLLALFTSPAYASTVLFESFEIPDTNNFVTFNAGSTFVTASNTWNVTSGSIDLYEAAARSEVAAHHLEQAVDLTGSPGAGVIETIFPTVVGQPYELSFFYARNNGLGNSIGDAEVDVVGSATLLNSLFQHNPGIHAFDTYLEFNDTFTADAMLSTLRFSSLEPGVAGITLDSISISVIPLPAAFWLMFSGLLSVFGIAKVRTAGSKPRIIGNH